jgi:hypothetical protein
MTNPQERAARARADAQRQRLMASVQEAKHRLAPSTIAQNTVNNLRSRTNRAVDGLRSRAGDASGDLKVRASDGVDTARRNPAVAAAVFGVLGLIFLRKPLTRLIKGRQTKAKPADLPPPLPPALTEQADPNTPLPDERALLREEQAA